MLTCLEIKAIFIFSMMSKSIDSTVKFVVLEQQQQLDSELIKLPSVSIVM